MKINKKTIKCLINDAKVQKIDNVDKLYIKGKGDDFIWVDVIL